MRQQFNCKSRITVINIYLKQHSTIGRLEKSLLTQVKRYPHYKLQINIDETSTLQARHSEQRTTGRMLIGVNPRLRWSGHSLADLIFSQVAARAFHGLLILLQPWAAPASHLLPSKVAGMPRSTEETWPTCCRHKTITLGEAPGFG